jgi:hypothetical protein
MALLRAVRLDFQKAGYATFWIGGARFLGLFRPYGLFCLAGFLSRKTNEIRARPADDARERCRRTRPPDRLVQGLSAPGRARPGRDGPAIWRRNAGDPIGESG